MIIPDIAYEWLTCRVSRLPHGGLSPDVLARIEADRQRASSLPLIEKNIPVDWTHDSSVRRRFKGHTYRPRRAWRQFAALRFDEQDVYIEVFSGFGFARGFGFKEMRIYLDGVLVGRAWQGACSLGSGGVPQWRCCEMVVRSGSLFSLAWMRSRKWWKSSDAPALPLRIDTDAYIVTNTGIVLDRNYKFLVEYDTIEEAEMFVAKANGVDVATLRLQMEESARMRHEYLRRLKQGKKRDAT